MTPAAPLIPNPSMDLARVLVRQYLSRKATEGWIREFSQDGKQCRISRTSSPSDAGEWFRAADLRIESILEPGKAPKRRKQGDDE